MKLTLGLQTDSQQEALDAIVDGKPVDPTWGDLDDVSEFIMKRHELFRSKKSHPICLSAIL